MCDQTVWADQINALEGIAEPFIADYGHLNSLPAMAAATLKTAPPKFALAGHSMGGRVALEMFRQAPDRITHLCLMDTRHHPLPAGEPGEKERAGRYALLEIARQKGTRVMGEEWVKGMVHPDRLEDSELIDAILDMFARKGADIFEAQHTALLNRPDAGMLMSSDPLSHPDPMRPRGRLVDARMAPGHGARDPRCHPNCDGSLRPHVHHGAPRGGLRCPQRVAHSLTTTNFPRLSNRVDTG